MNLIFTLNIIGGVNLEGSRYPYTCMQQLMELNKCRQVPKPTLPQEQNPSVVDESTILPRANSVDR